MSRPHQHLRLLIAVACSVVTPAAIAADAEDDAQPRSGERAQEEPYASELPADSPRTVTVGAAELDDAIVQRREAAITLANRGYELLAKGRHREAIVLLDKADAAFHSPVISEVRARAYDELGNLLKAYALLRRIAAEPAVPEEPDAFPDARKRARERLRQLEVRLPSIRIRLGGEDARQLEVRLDGRALAPVELKRAIRANPGAHTVTATAPGRELFRTDFVLAEGSRESIVLPPPQQPASLIAPTVAFAIAGAAAVAGVATAVAYAVRSDNLRDQCPDNACAPQLRTEVSQVETLGTVSIVSFTAAGVAALTGAGMLLFLPPASEQPDEIASWPALRVGVGAIELFGSF